MTSETDRSTPQFLIAALGASAGGLEPLEEFFRHMPADADIAFVIVQHLAPDHATALPQLLARHTEMPVEQARDKTEVAPNRVYVIPPNATLTIEDGALRVTDPVAARGSRTPIDSFFRSLAEDRGENAVCIMLSGTGSDGTLGLRAIKEHGGMAMAQTLDSAKYDTILRSAISTGLVDHVLPVEEMPAKLLEYAEYLASLNGKPNSIREQLAAHMARVHYVLRQRAGHDFSQYKESTIARRLERRMRAAQIETVEAYVQLLERQPEEVDRLFNDLLIGVTHFFRDAEAFEALGRNVIPRLFEDKDAGSEVRVCAVGCATGEEAYSIAILLLEHAATLDKAPRMQIFGTDIDERSLEMARKGCYPESIAEQISPERLQRFFTKEDSGAYRVKRELREICLFSVHSFIKDPPFSRLNLISCRNVMIYLGQDLQRKIVPLFHYALLPGGYLFLGPSESASSHRELFETVDKKNRIFQRKEVLPRPVIAFPFAESSSPAQAGAKRPEAEDHNLPKHLERIILQRYRPACVTVKENGDAVYFSGRISRYLEQPTGTPDTNVINMARESLRIPLRTALHKAVTARERVIQKHVPVQTNGAVSHIDLTVEPLADFRPANLYMIVFEEVVPASGPPEGAPATPDAGPEETIRHLEDELRSAQQHAQAMFEELESSNEELKSANEEYQSANEELETSKEELQSFNEELQTVNAEVSRKVIELDHANNDLQNLLNSTQIATIFLDPEIRIRSFTPAAGSVFRLIPGDVGRPITDLAAQFSDVNLVQEIREVLTTLITRERQLTGTHGRHYQMRILPYRTVQNVIDGVVLTFTDVGQLKEAQQQAENAKTYAENIIHTIREPLIVLDANLRVQTANQSYYDEFHVSANETVGKLFYALGDGQWDIPDLRRMLARLIPERKTLEDFEVQYTFQRTGLKTILLNARQVVTQNGQAPLILLAMEDITERKQAAALVACQKQAFEMFTAGEPLLKVLRVFVGTVEGQSHPGAAVAIHLLDESTTRFEHTVALSMPPEYCSAIDGMDVSSAVGPCCAAISSRQRVVIPNDEFAAATSFAPPAGFRSGWCTPIFASNGKVLGTVAAYYREPRTPQPRDDFFGEIVTRTAAIVIERQQADEKLRRLNEDLRHFAYAASHDLQEPLRMVMSYSQLLARKYKGRFDPQADQFIGYAIEGAERMEVLLKGLRDYWSVNDRKLEQDVLVDCNRVLETVLGDVDSRIQESGAIITHDPLPTVVAEELPLVLLFQNLIVNAIKYRRSDAPRIHVSAQRRVTAWHFAVADNGIGIEAEYLETVFAPFKRLHGAEIAGTGIGLAICRKIVERYGGRIWVESIYGQGSVFHFTIPAQGGNR